MHDTDTAVCRRFPKRFEYDSASSGQRETPHTTDEQQQTQVMQKQLVRKLYRIEDARGVVNVQEGACKSQQQFRDMLRAPVRPEAGAGAENNL